MKSMSGSRSRSSNVGGQSRSTAAIGHARTPSAGISHGINPFIGNPYVMPNAYATNPNLLPNPYPIAMQPTYDQASASNPFEQSLSAPSNYSPSLGLSIDRREPDIIVPAP